MKKTKQIIYRYNEKFIKLKSIYNFNYNPYLLRKNNLWIFLCIFSINIRSKNKEEIEIYDKIIEIQQDRSTVIRWNNMTYEKVKEDLRNHKITLPKWYPCSSPI